MAEILTDSEIAEIEARAEKATERYVIDYSKGDYARLMDRGHGGIEPRTIAIFDPFQGYRDLSFCENARTDIPRLIASHRTLAAERDDLNNRSHHTVFFLCGCVFKQEGLDDEPRLIAHCKASTVNDSLTAVESFRERAVRAIQEARSLENTWIAKQSAIGILESLPLEPEQEGNKRIT